MKRYRRFFKFLLVVAILTGLFVWYIGMELFSSRPSVVGYLPKDLAVHSENFRFENGSGGQLHGWFISGRKGAPVIILMHDVGGSRRIMIERAQFLNERGYAIMFFDFTGEGESDGTHVTYGVQESKDAQASLAWVKQRAPGVKIGLFGVGLGGAAALLADPPLDVDVMVLEMVYPTFEDGIKDRLSVRMGSIGYYLDPLFTWQFKPRLDFGAEDVRPMDQAAKIIIPKLFIYGDGDKHTRVEGETLYRAAAQPKQAWIVEGATRTDFCSHYPREYIRRVMDFLDVYLKCPSNY